MHIQINNILNSFTGALRVHEQSSKGSNVFFITMSLVHCIINQTVSHKTFSMDRGGVKYIESNQLNYDTCIKSKKKNLKKLNYQYQYKIFQM